MRLHTHIAELSLPKEKNRRTRACDENDFTHAGNKTKRNESQAQASSIAALAFGLGRDIWSLVRGRGAEYAGRLNRCVGLWVERESFSVSSLEGMISKMKRP